METVNIEKDKLNKLVELFNKVIKSDDLSKTQIKSLRYLIKKTKGKTEVRQIFPIITIYLKNKDKYLKVYLTNLLNELKN